MGVDALSLAAAGVCAWALWALPIRHQSLQVYLPALPLLLIAVLGYGIVGLYPGFGLGPVERLRRIWLVSLTVFIGIAALTFALRSPDLYSRATLGLALILTLILVPAGQAVLRRRASGWSWWREPVALVGDGAAIAHALELLRAGASGEYRPVAVLTQSASAEAPQGTDLPVVGTVAEARQLARAGVQMVFADVRGPDAEAVLDHLRLVFPKVVVLREFQELPVEGVQVRNLGGVLGLEYGSQLLRNEIRLIKRLVDLVAGGVALVVSAPLVLVAMATVKLVSPGPALYHQTREGLKGASIDVPKIRTMIPDAEAHLAEVLANDPELSREWEESFKLRRDPRLVPWVGRPLRRFSVDELPQLWSVVKGDMSLVGPRPFPPYHLERLSFQARRLRNQVRPGLTGLWQVTARGEADIEEQQAYDIHYIRNWSLWLDLHIVARTLWVVISGRGAY